MDGDFYSKKSILMYIIGSLVVTYILVIARYKIKYPFWSKLPAFHKTKFLYWLKSEQILDVKPLTRERNYYHRTYKTECLNDVTEETMNDVVGFINNEYMNYNDAVYSITATQLNNIKTKNTFITHYHGDGCDRGDRCNGGNRGKDVDESLGGCIISLPFMMWSKPWNNPASQLGNKYRHSKNDLLNINYVDYLCIHKNQRKTDKASSLIYTHLANCGDKSMKNYRLPLFLFKNEGFKTSALVPIVDYHGYVIDLEDVTIERCTVNLSVLNKESCTCVHVDPSNVKLINECVTCIYDLDILEKLHFNFVALFPKEVLITHIKTNEIIVFCLLRKNTICGFYFFKNIHSLIDKQKYEFVCIGSLELSKKKKQSDVDNNMPFIYGFKIACVLCKNYLNGLFCQKDKDGESKTSYDLCCIEELSHNYNIIHATSIGKKHKYKIPIAYYSYNGLIHTKHQKNAFILS